jgi:hypothetical protein
MASELKRVLHKESKILFVATYSEDAESPRTMYDNLCTMLCFHNRYNLGDTDSLLRKKGFNYDSDDYDSWEEMEKAIIKENDIAIILPLWLYDHSGLTISFGRTCSWDSGQVGFILVDKATIRKEYSCKRISKKLLLKVEEILKNEVKEYDSYLRGDVYDLNQYTISDEYMSEIESENIDIDEIDIDMLEEVESCSNYIGESWLDDAINNSISYLNKKYLSQKAETI